MDKPAALIFYRISASFLLPVLMFLQTSAQRSLYKVIPPQYELEHIKFSFKETPGLFSDIKEDKEGNLWLPSTQGLHVFDGHNVTTYRTNSKAYHLSSPSGSNEFSYSTMDQKGCLWMTEDNNRFIKFDPLKRTIVDHFYSNPAPGEGNFMLATHASSGLFFTTTNFEKGHIALFRKTGNGAAEKLFETGFNKSSGVFYRLVGNDHWIVDGDTAIRLSLDGKRITRYSYPGGSILHLLLFADDRFIYFSDIEHQAIYYFNRASEKLELFLKLPALERGKVQVIYIENDKVYLGSNLYLFIINRVAGTMQDMSPQFTELARREVPNSLSEQLIQFFRQDDGTILLLTVSNIFRIKKKVPPLVRFRQQVDAEINASRPVSYRALAEDDNKNIYASYYTGISKKAAGKATFIKWPTNQYLNGERISTYSLHYWHGFLLWNNVKIELATGKFRYLFDSIFSGHCVQFLQHDSLWLYKWGSKMFHCYDLTHDILSSYLLEPATNTNMNARGIFDINDIVSDASGKNLWIGSHYFGLCLVSKKGKLIKQYWHKDLSISDDYITDLEQVGELLWFGCTDGLGVLNTVTGKTSIYKNPVINNGRLTNRAVFGIQSDSIGNFYLGSSYGILYFDTKATTFYNLPEGHPLSTPEFNRASVFKTSDGRYYFGSTDGLYSFTSNELEFLKVSNTLKPVKLYGVSIFNSKENRYHYLSENLDGLKKLVLDPFDNTIEFSFSAPEFYQDVYYSYRIKNQGDKWTEYKPDNKILLFGLQPGNYTLEIKASTSLSDENASYYSLPISMKQVWYNKIWVIVLFSILLVGLIAGLLRYRFNQKVKRQKDLAALRTRISSDLHDDVGTILSGLAMQSQMLTYSAKEDQKGPLNEISNMSRDAMEHMRDTVWAMDSRKDKYENLIDRMRDFAEKNLALKNITHEFIISDIDTKKFIDPEKRQTVYLIFKEAITNIIKHSDGKHVCITFAHTKNNLHLTIRDNGAGKTNRNSDGLGLSNMKMRAGKIGGTLTTKYENGFVVELNL